MVTVYTYQNGQTRKEERLDPAWIEPDSSVLVWVDLSNPTPSESSILADVFQFHPLAIEDAVSELQFPKIEAYDSYLYLVLHGIDISARTQRDHLSTRDFDFFLGRTYLVSIHGAESRSIDRVRQICDRHGQALREGPTALLHRIVDTMVDNYRPEIDDLEAQIEKLEELAFSSQGSMTRELLALKRDLSTVRRIVIPQRDAIARLARREFSAISDEMAYRFRDVLDHLVRIADEVAMFQDRVTGILDAHLASVSNRLNEVMKVLTVMSTIFLPLTVLTGMWGMNVALPALPGGPAAQFWWICAAMAAVTLAQLAFFRRRGWI